MIYAISVFNSPIQSWMIGVPGKRLPGNLWNPFHCNTIWDVLHYAKVQWLDKKNPVWGWVQHLLPTTRIIGRIRVTSPSTFAAVVLCSTEWFPCRPVPWLFDLACFWAAGIVTLRAIPCVWKIPGEPILLLQAKLYKWNGAEAMVVWPQLDVR